MLLGRNFDEIDGATIAALVTAGATESIYLDFKRQSYGGSEADKKELLKDVSSFANTLGGHLLIGVAEIDGVATEVIPLAGLDIDIEMQRFESILRAGLEPAIIGLRLKRVAVAAGHVIVVYVPRSLNPPHRIVFSKSNRYYARSSAGCYELSLEELRMLFGQRQSLQKRANELVEARFSKVEAQDGPIYLASTIGAIVLQLIPLADFAAERRIDVRTLDQHKQHFSPIGASAHSWRINLEGLLIYRGGAACHGYTQIYRDGSVEATSTSVIGEYQGKRYIASRDLPRKIIESLSAYMKGLRSIEASPPILLQISFFGTADVELHEDKWEMFEAPPPYHRRELHLPSAIISHYQDDGDYQAVVAEQMHFLWNTFGFERCNYFDANERWVGK